MQPCIYVLGYVDEHIGGLDDAVNKSSIMVLGGNVRATPVPVLGQMVLTWFPRLMVFCPLPSSLRAQNRSRIMTMNLCSLRSREALISLIITIVYSTFDVCFFELDNILLRVTKIFIKYVYSLCLLMLLAVLIHRDEDT